MITWKFSLTIYSWILFNVAKIKSIYLNYVIQCVPCAHCCTSLFMPYFSYKVPCTMKFWVSVSVSASYPHSFTIYRSWDQVSTTFENSQETSSTCPHPYKLELAAGNSFNLMFPRWCPSQKATLFCFTPKHCQLNFPHDHCIHLHLGETTISISNTVSFSAIYFVVKANPHPHNLTETDIANHFHF